MKYIDILFFVLCINVSLYLISSIGISSVLGGAHEMEAEVGWIEEYNKTASATTLEWQNPTILDYMLALGVTLWKGIVMFFQIFIQVVLLQPTLVMLGIPSLPATIISTPVYFIYVWGIFQILTGKGGKQME